MNRFIYLVLLFAIALPALSQNSSPDAIRKQMAKIRQTTNWNDPAAAKKANEEIQKLAQKLTGQPVKPAGNASQPTKTPGELLIKSPPTEGNVLAIASRFYTRSYKALDAISKQQFDLDFKQAGYDKFSFSAVRKLTSAGATLTTLGSDHNLACVYLTAALKARPTDTLSANNFGGYLRVIDSIEASVPVLLYANSLFGQSPVILTQLGCSYIELNDEKTGENYLKQAIGYNPDFGQAHSALCDLYIKQNRLKEAIEQLFAGVKGIGVSYSKASNNYAYMQKQAEDAGEAGNQSAKEDFWDETRNQLEPPDPLASLVPEDVRIKMPSFPNCDKVADWTEGGGYSSAVDGYSRFHAKLMAFSSEFLQVHTELPSLPPNAILRDYPNERFALDCITEYFFQESDKVDVESHTY
jgi:tetratricopeptide (TPR) repeat protein